MQTKTLFAILMLAPVIAVAGVNPKNGNFFITYEDIAQKSGRHELSLRRTYNSKASELGWFGYGWGTPFETRLITMPDGSAAVQENGTGQINYYRAKEKADIEKGVARIVEAATQREQLSSDAAAALGKQLIRNEDNRVAKVRKYALQFDLPVNAVLRSTDCPAAALTRVADSYQRITCDRTKDTFDLQGHLIRREDSDGYSFSINYEGKRPAGIADTLGQKLDFTWSAAGYLQSASGKGQKLTYAQDQNNNLVSSKIQDGNTYDMAYDGNHNLTSITYIDNSSMRVAYVSSEGAVQSVTERNGDKTTYAYRTDPKDAQHYWTTVTSIPVSGSQSSRDYEYQQRTTETGAEQLAQFTASDERNRRESTFDAKGRIVRKANNNGGYSEYVYHPQTDKLIMVFNKDLKTEFHYDEQGNLTHAENSDGQVIDLEYANSPLIRRIIEVNRTQKTRRELTFSYNKAGRPGKINVEYDDQGEISKVSSSKGAKMALQVTQAFQALLSVVSVAGAKI